MLHKILHVWLSTWQFSNHFAAKSTPTSSRHVLEGYWGLLFLGTVTLRMSSGHFGRIYLLNRITFLERLSLFLKIKFNFDHVISDKVSRILTQLNFLPRNVHFSRWGAPITSRKKIEMTQPWRCVCLVWIGALRKSPCESYQSVDWLVKISGVASDKIARMRAGIQAFIFVKEFNVSE